MRLAKLVTVMGLVLVTGCAVTPPALIEPQVAGAGGRILSFIVIDRRTQLLETMPDTRTLHASLRAIPGALYGVPSRQHAQLVPMHPGMNFELSMTALEAAIAPLAATATPAMRAGGIRMVPDSTRIARVGTVVFDSALQRDVLGAGFIDAEATPSTDVSLVYFDRACDLEGEETQLGVTYVYALHVPAAGLHWMRFDAADPSRVRISLADPRATIWFAGYR
jgi:hypothetical protein